MYWDFRVILGLAVEEAGYSYSFTEAYYLFLGLFEETNSKLNAKVNNWERAFTRVEEALIDNGNLFIAANSEKGKEVFLKKPNEKQSNNIIKNKAIAYERAEELYVYKRQDFTPEQAAALNAKYNESKKEQ